MASSDTPPCMGCDGDSSTGPGQPTLRDGLVLCRTCWDLTIALVFGGQLRDGTPVPEIRRIVRERAQAQVKTVVRRVLCPHCKRVVEARPASTQDHFVLQTHDIAPMLRQVCEGSGEAASFEGSYLAAEEIERLRGWLRAIAYTPHLGCDRVPGDVGEIIDEVEKSIDVHGKGENPNCGTCRAQAALSGRPAP